MKKVGLLVLLTCVAVALYGSFLIPSSPLSVTSRVICLILFSCVSSSAALMALVWVLQGTWSTTTRPVSSNRLATLAEKERKILAGKATQKVKTAGKHITADRKVGLH